MLQPPEQHSIEWQRLVVSLYYYVLSAKRDLQKPGLFAKQT